MAPNQAETSARKTPRSPIKAGRIKTVEVRIINAVTPESMGKTVLPGP